MNKYRVPQSTGLRKTKLFDRVVGQAVALVVPTGYQEMVAKLAAPAPTVALTVRVINGQVKSIKLAEEKEAREPKGRMTLEHPFVVSLLAGYTLIDSYELRSQPGVVVRSYAEAQGSGGAGEKEIVQTGPAQALVVEVEPEIKPVSPAQEIALSLKTEYPNLAASIDLALVAVEAGLESSYKTEWDNAGRYGTISCDCPQATYRNPRTRWGAGCKHGLALTIKNLLKEREAGIRNREVEKRQERGSGVRGRGPTGKSGTDIIREIEAENAARFEREQARYAAALKPERGNLAARPNVAFKGIGHL